MRPLVIQTLRWDNLHGQGGITLPREPNEGTVSGLIVLDANRNESASRKSDSVRLDHVPVQVTCSIRELVNNEDVIDPELDPVIAVHLKAIGLRVLRQDVALPLNTDVI